jgi:hypothetical protein
MTSARLMSASGYLDQFVKAKTFAPQFEVNDQILDGDRTGWTMMLLEPDVAEAVAVLDHVKRM